jgi:hypothetical protein
MDPELLRQLLAAFPARSRHQPETPDDDFLVVRGGYRVPFDSPIGDVMPEFMADQAHHVAATLRDRA